MMILKKKRVFVIALAIVIICFLWNIPAYNNVENSIMIMTSANKAKDSKSLDENQAKSNTSINTVLVKSTFYNYYSDSQISTDDKVRPINDGSSKYDNTFKKFNSRLLDTKQYASIMNSPAEWPLYMGKVPINNLVQIDKDWKDKNWKDKDWKDKNWKDKDWIDNIKLNQEVRFTTNYWVGANWGQSYRISMATQDLVDANLDKDGDITQSNDKTNRSCKLPYFDKAYLINTKHDSSKLSLGEFRDNVQFPLVETQKDGIKYYSFDSSIDTVSFKQNNELEYLGKMNKQIFDSDGKPGFFPFNKREDSGGKKLDYGFGAKLEIEFKMTKDGKINGKDMIFEYKGDDDCWVFIDGILALDMGGIHNEMNGTINFASLSSTVSAVKNNTIALSSPYFFYLQNREYSVQEMKALGIYVKNKPEKGIFFNKQDAFSKELKDKLKNTTSSHKMTIFYIERGESQSNFKMNCNIPIIPLEEKIEVQSDLKERVAGFYAYSFDENDTNMFNGIEFTVEDKNDRLTALVVSNSPNVEDVKNYISPDDICIKEGENEISPTLMKNIPKNEYDNTKYSKFVEENQNEKIFLLRTNKKYTLTIRSEYFNKQKFVSRKSIWFHGDILKYRSMAEARIMNRATFLLG